MKSSEGEKDDHVLTPQEVYLSGIETQEQDMEYFIATLKEHGLPVPPESEARLRALQLNKKTFQYLSGITDPVLLEEAHKRINSGDFPPEIFSSDNNFIVEGPETRQ